MSEPLVLDAGGLSIVLSRIADRYRHELLLTTEDRRVVLTSLEGTNEQPWPPSPPFQEIHTQQIGDNVNAMLLVGRAGRGHWSASIEVDRSRETVLFDIACRSSGPIEWLGSTYQCVGSDAVTITDEGRRLLLPSCLEAQVLEGEARLRDDGPVGLLTIVPTWAASSGAQTIRWRYRIGRAP